MGLACIASHGLFMSASAVNQKSNGRCSSYLESLLMEVKDVRVVIRACKSSYGMILCVGSISSASAFPVCSSHSRSLCSCDARASVYVKLCVTLKNLNDIKHACGVSINTQQQNITLTIVIRVVASSFNIVIEIE